MATDNRFEHFIERDDDWFSDIELKVLDLEKELCEWRESRTRDLGYAPDSAPSGERPGDAAGDGRPREFLRAGRARPAPAARPAWPAEPDEPLQAADRTQALIDRGRRTARRSTVPRRAGRRPATRRPAAARRTGRRPRPRRGRMIAIGTAVVLAVLVVGAMIVLRKGPSWPPSVATVQREITAACQNPNVSAEPSQVNFACGHDTSQILWVFSLMTSNNDPGYADPRTGRKGLEPIAPAQGGQVAWSLNLHHPYNPLNPVDSLAVAARAINNIIGGATLTGASGRPAVQPGLESKPENCARYTGSSAIVSHAGFPGLCASPVISREGRAALVADVYQRWMPGASAVAAQNVSVLFQNAGNPGDPQVQAILKTLPHPGR
jgi:hypothetical protein